MFQKLLSSLAVVAAIFLGAPAFAGNPHFIKNLSSASLQGASLVCTFKEAGLPSGAVETVTCEALETVTYECVNGGNKNPSADNKHSFTTQTSQSGQFTADQNGNIEGTLELDPLTASQVGFSCPPGQTTTFVSVTYSDVSVIDEDSGASLPFRGSFTYSDPSAPRVR
jgi:hypothetical protein